jgi:hypothetical protein
MFNINAEQFVRCLEFCPIMEENLIAIGTFDGRVIIQSTLD